MVALIFLYTRNTSCLVYKNAPRGNTLVRKEMTSSLALGVVVLPSQNTLLFKFSFIGNTNREGTETLPYDLEQGGNL